MRSIIARGIVFLSFLSLTAMGQKQTMPEVEVLRVYTTLSEALANPDSVYRLRLREKLTKVPDEVFTAFPNLLELDLGRNRLRDLPTTIGVLKKLKRFIADRNKLTTLPKEIGDMENLQELILNRNELTHLPTDIGRLNQLKLLDIWSNNIDELPASMRDMPALKEVDMRVIVISDEKKKDIKALLPQVKVHLDKGCNCPN